MNIAVYCSAAEGLSSNWQEAAQMVGQWIGRHNATLVYGGVDAGLMRVISHAVKEYGGNVVGIIPTRRFRSISKYNDINIATTDLHDRKAKLQILADIYIVLPGGYGTLDEFASTFSYINFTEQANKHIIIYNHAHLYDYLLQQLKLMVDKGLMRRKCLDTIHVAETTEQLITTLNNLTTDKND
jgi:uncharacterized protein (TIGR00730 family)